MKDSIMHRKQEREKPKPSKPAGKFSGGATLKRVDEAVTDLDDLLDDMATSRVRRTHQQDELLDEVRILLSVCRRKVVTISDVNY